jgi:ABC-type sugar transport system permease subunit/ABC-type glycerol-3-phosphate transport system substrate-binding protein
MRGWLILLVLLQFAVSLADEVEVTLFEGGEGLSFYRSVAREFEEKHPDTTVLLQGDPAIADKMRMRVLEGNLPEVTNANVDVWSLIEHGYVQSLDSWLDQPRQDGTTWRESFLPGSLEQYQQGGQTYGVPLVYVVWSVYYNKKLFAERGWEIPETWPEYLELCQRMKDSGLVPIAFQGRYSYYARPLVEHTYFHLAGRQAHRAQSQVEPGSFDNPAMVESLELLSTLAREFFQPGFSGMSHTEAQLEFFQGRAAMLFCGSWLYSEMQDNIPEGFELGAFPLPLPISDRADPDAQYASSGYFFVFQKSKNPSRGVEFLEELTAPETAGRFAAERGIPVAVSGGNRGLHRAMQDVAVQLSSIRSTFGPSNGPAIKGLDQVWTDNLGRLLSGGVEAREVAATMEREAGAARQRALQPDALEVRHPIKAVLFGVFLGLGLLLGLARKGHSSPSDQARVSRSEMSKFLLPALFFFTLFFALPSFVALGASLFRWDGIGEPEFVGLFHLKELLLESDIFWSSLGHNLILMFVPAVLVLPLSLLLASLLHQGVVGSRLFRVVFFFPNLLGVAGVLLWQQLYNPQIGPINKILVVLGFTRFESFAWLSAENLYYALIPMAVWSAAGFNMVLFLAAMQSVPTSLYEAADIHGANRWQKFRYITLPLIRDTVGVAMVLMVIGGMKAFESIWLLTNQAPTSETHVVGTLMVRSLFVEQRVGQAAALACLLFVIVLVGSVMGHRLSEEAT